MDDHGRPLGSEAPKRFGDLRHDACVRAGKAWRFFSKTFHRMLAEMTVSGVVSDNFDITGTAV